MAEHRSRRLEYIACHDAGMSVIEAANHIGCSLAAVHTFASRNGRTFRNTRSSKTKPVFSTKTKSPAFSVSPQAISKYEARATQ